VVEDMRRELAEGRLSVPAVGAVVKGETPDLPFVVVDGDGERLEPVVAYLRDLMLGHCSPLTCRSLNRYGFDLLCGGWHRLWWFLGIAWDRATEADAATQPSARELASKCTSPRRSPHNSPRRSPALAISSTISRSRAERQAHSTPTISSSPAPIDGRVRLTQPMPNPQPPRHPAPLAARLRGQITIVGDLVQAATPHRPGCGRRNGGDRSGCKPPGSLGR
jgi:hypothetical protein